MSSIIGNNIKISIFGESHGSYVGGTLDGFPAGEKLDLDFLKKEMAKRRGSGVLSTARIEEDDFEIVSGIFNGYTTGMPITILIKNKNTKSSDYNKLKSVPRPSHADYTAFVKYNGYNDYRGGGHFSGRLTAPIVALGAICRCALKSKGIEIYSHIKSIGEIDSIDILNCSINNETIETLNTDFPVLDENIKNQFVNEIKKNKDVGDSVGGSVQTVVSGLSIGKGAPIFDNIESNISKLIFSVPAIKALEFGKGIEMSKGTGSNYNDSYEIINGVSKTRTNNNGGINGGISNGENIVFTSYFKPTPSIAKKQKSFKIETLQEEDLEIEGRHDPCIVTRGVHVISNITAFGVLDIILGEKENI